MKQSISLFLSLTLLVTLASTALAGGEKGKIHSLSAASRTVTMKDEKGQLHTFNISSNTIIKRNGKNSTLTDFVLRDSLKVTTTKGSTIPKKVKAKGNKVKTVTGTVTHFNTGTGILQIGTRNLQTSKSTRVVRNGKPSSLGSLTTRDTVVVHVQGESDDCDDIQAEGDDESEVEGTITAVDTTANTVTVQSEEDGSEVTVNVTAETEIEVDDQDATIADLQAGMEAEAEYDPTTMDAFSIEAEVEEAEIEGTIMAIDLTASSVTIQDGDGNSVTVIVDASTQIERDGESAFIEDLAVGDAANAKYDPVTFIAFSIKAHSNDEEEDGEIEGTITNVDAGASTVTIQNEETGDSVTLSITADTCIEVENDDSQDLVRGEDDDCTGTIEDLVIGDEAEAEFDPATMVASFIQAEGEDD